MRDFSAIGYIFARRLYMATQVPIGMINVSRGGTTVETWTPLAVLRQIDRKQAGTGNTSLRAERLPPYRVDARPLEWAFLLEPNKFSEGA
ncbi:MAG TPA: hypothetical protein DCS43_10275 [Verrucomicrobia bacterium]|nr:hypothetical protein [Verrucomicrobiota bacterium]